MLLFLLACAPPPLPAVNTQPAITILWPEEESDVVACTLMIVEFDNFVIRPYDLEKGDAPNAPGEGHWHAYYGETYAMSYAPYALLDMTELVAGDYTVVAQLEENDHSAMLDEDGHTIEDEIHIHLEAGECQASTEGLPAY